MISLLIRVSLTLLVLNQVLTPAAALRSYKGDLSNERSEMKSFRNQQSAPYNVMSATIPNKPPKRGLGISAWGIIMVILGMIFAGLGVYYFSMCYPILCKKERKYNIIEVATV